MAKETCAEAPGSGAAIAAAPTVGGEPGFSKVPSAVKILGTWIDCSGQTSARTQRAGSVTTLILAVGDPRGA